MCNAKTMLLMDSSSAAAALADTARDQASGGILHAIAGIALGLGVAAVVLVAVVAVADYISHGCLLK
jgi:hypothetical protein